MIKKLRKKLILLFLFFTMSAFTIIILLMAGSIVANVQKSEMLFTANMCDSIKAQVKAGAGINDSDLSSNMNQVGGWVSISDGNSEISGQQHFTTSTDILMGQMNSQNIFSSTSVESDGNIETDIRTMYLVSGLQDEKYCGIHDIFQVSGTKYDLIFIAPQSKLWEIIKNNCSWYPFIWLSVLLLMYLMSRLLIGKAVEPVEATMKSQKRFIAAASHELKRLCQ